VAIKLKLNQASVEGGRLSVVVESCPLPSGWLDDIGLPQYKSQFEEARVDGRMLHFMTVVSRIPHFRTPYT